MELSKGKSKVELARTQKWSPRAGVWHGGYVDKSCPEDRQFLGMMKILLSRDGMQNSSRPPAETNASLQLQPLSNESIQTRSSGHEKWPIAELVQVLWETMSFMRQGDKRFWRSRSAWWNSILMSVGTYGRPNFERPG